MESDITMILTLFKLIFGGLGILLIILSVVALSSTKKKRKACTKKIKACIVGVECLKTFSVDGYGADSWHPVYEYMVNGKSMRKRSSIGHAHKNYREGEKVYIYINPEKPDEIYSPEEKEGFIPKIFISIGILLLLLCVVIILLGF